MGAIANPQDPDPLELRPEIEMFEAKIPGSSSGKTGVDVQVGDEHGGANPTRVECNLPDRGALVNI
jgi:hypothetical protein